MRMEARENGITGTRPVMTEAFVIANRGERTGREPRALHTPHVMAGLVPAIPI
jgi:hypothetical protein